MSGIVPTKPPALEGISTVERKWREGVTNGVNLAPLVSLFGAGMLPVKSDGKWSGYTAQQLLEEQIVIQHFLPTITGQSGMTIGEQEVHQAKFTRIGPLISAHVRFSIDTLTSPSDKVSFNVPIPADHVVVGGGGTSFGENGDIVVYQPDSGDRDQMYVKKTSGNFSDPENDIAISVIYLRGVGDGTGELIGALGVTKP